jgi:YHS domain-containing protein
MIKILTLLLAGFFLASSAFAGEPAKDGKKDEAQKEAKIQKSFDSPPAVGTKAICPVMNSEFVVKEDSPRSEYQGRHYVFCCTGCKPMFDKDPGKYAGKK